MHLSIVFVSSHSVVLAIVAGACAHGRFSLCALVHLPLCVLLKCTCRTHISTLLQLASRCVHVPVVLHAPCCFGGHLDAALQVCLVLLDDSIVAIIVLVVRSTPAPLASSTSLECNGHRACCACPILSVSHGAAAKAWCRASSKLARRNVQHLPGYRLYLNSELRQDEATDTRLDTSDSSRERSALPLLHNAVSTNRAHLHCRPHTPEVYTNGEAKYARRNAARARGDAERLCANWQFRSFQDS